MSVVLLGTGTPNADPERSGPCVAIVVDNHAYLVDAGPGLVRRAAAAAITLHLPALEPKNLDCVFITHLHSDHTVGLPDLMLTPWVLERKVPLRAYGPPGLKSMTDHLLAAYGEDIENRLDGLQPAEREGWGVEAHEIVPGEIYRDERVRVLAVPVTHGHWKQAFAYRFEGPDRSVVISGDTTPCEALIDAARGCDVLVHEVYSADRFESRPPEWRRYHAASHTSTRQLAEIASKVKPRLLVLYHQLFWGASDADLVREVRAGYSGAVISGRDLERY